MHGMFFVYQHPLLSFISIYYSAVHFEYQPHKWAIFWTTLREGTHQVGNNFFLSSYGIRIKAAADTSVCWQPCLYHTSSVGSFEVTFDDVDLESPRFNQQGIAFVTSSRISGIYRKWKEAQGISGEQRFKGATAEMAAAADVEEDEVYD